MMKVNPLPVLKVGDYQESSLKALFQNDETTLVKREIIAQVEQVQCELQEARTHAHTIIEAARSEAESIRRYAHKEGEKQGYSELYEILSRAREQYDQVIEQAERDMVELAFRIAQQILGKKLELEPELIVEIVAHNLKNVRGQGQIVVFIHASDLPYVQAARPYLKSTVHGAEVVFEVSPNIEPGDCLIATEAGRIDARLSMQLEVIQQAMVQGVSQ